MNDPKKVYGIKGSKVVLVENDDQYVLNISGLPTEEPELSVEIPKSALMEEWRVAYPPSLYRSAFVKRFVLQNAIVCDINTMHWWSLTRPYQQHQLSNVAFKTIVDSLEVPEAYKEELTGPLGLENVADMTISGIDENWDKIPKSINVAKWHIHKASIALALEEIWKKVPFFAKFDGITKPSDKSIKYQLKTFHRVNRQYVSSEFKRIRTQRKVVMPLQLPDKLENFGGLCLTSTPQSEKAGSISELAVDTKLDDYGRFVEIPDKQLSTTSILCPFPQKMAANREVVLCALSQAMYLREPEKPLVNNEIWRRRCL